MMMITGWPHHCTRSRGNNNKLWHRRSDPEPAVAEGATVFFVFFSMLIHFGNTVNPWWLTCGCSGVFAVGLNQMEDCVLCLLHLIHC